MKTTFIRVYVDCKEELDEAMKNYRRNTGEAITFAELLKGLLHDDVVREKSDWK